VEGVAEGRAWITIASLAAPTQVQYREHPIVPILTNVVDNSACVDALHPRAGRSVVEQARVPAVVREGAAAAWALEAAAEFSDSGLSFPAWEYRYINVGQVGFVPGGSKRSPVSVPEARGIEYLHRFKVPSSQEFRSEVLKRCEYQRKRSSRAPGALNKGWTEKLGSAGSAGYVLNQELWIESCSELA